MKGHLREYSLFFVFRAILYPVLFFIPVILEEKGVTGWQTGILVGEAGIVGILLSFPHGVMNDRIESKILIIASLALGGIFLLLLSHVSSFVFLLFIFLLFGLSRNLFQISFDSLFFKQIVKGEGCEHVGRYYLVAAAAVVLGLLATAWFSERFRLDSLFTCAGIAYFISIIPSWKLGLSGTEKTDISDYGDDMIKSAPRALLPVLFLFSLHWGAEDTCYGLFLRHCLSASISESAIYMSAEFVSLGATAYIAGRMIDRHRPDLVKLFIFGTFISGIFMLLKVNDIFILSLAMRMLHGTGDAIVMVVIYYGMAKSFSIGRIGGNISIILLTLTAGNFIGSMIFSKIGAMSGYEYPFIISGIILIAMSAILLMNVPKSGLNKISR
jgi:MFS family permease